MTRFWISLEQGAKFVVRCIEQMHGGEIFVPKIPNMKLTEMAEAIATGCEVEYIGIRPGEKLHEVLVSEDEARNAVELDDMYVIQPLRSWWRAENWRGGISLPDGFRYTSDSNSRWLTNQELQALIAPNVALHSPASVDAQPAYPWTRHRRVQWSVAGV